MRRFSIAAVAAVSTIAFVQFASAADLPTKAPIYTAPPPPVWSWTGFYIGVNVGGSIGRDPTHVSEFGPGVIGNIVSQTISPAGFIGGGQIGYNYQFAPNWVVGLEGDYQGASQKDSSCFGSCGAIGGGSAALNITQKVESFATARARLGYTGSPYLWYVTGGAAWAKVHNELVFTTASIASEGSANFNKSGWAIGGGVETRLAGGWTAKLEYLYMDLGSITDVAVATLPLTIFTQKSDIRDNIVRVGLNYKFY